uniref:Protein delta homolog 2 n=1 Tax=Erpetoichthys calabaricus TaxID=27687 RepID=A0A8C4SSI5_ERPCA
MWKLTLLVMTMWMALTWHNVAQGVECKPGCNLGHGHCDENGICRCDPGWEGELCEDCTRMLGCVHGTCHQSWQCICEEGWAGRFCDKDIHVCTNHNPCQNGATCISSEDGEYSCVCPKDFHGKNCEFKTGPCDKAKMPCKNGGMCSDDNGYAQELSCRCLAGFVGPRCEVNVDDCLMRPCANGATCHDGINRFSCECQAGFKGRFCTINIDDCVSNPCLNNGRCFDRVNDFDCVCLQGYTGKTCSVSTAKSQLDVGRSVPKNWTSTYPRSTLSQPSKGQGSSWGNVSFPPYKDHAVSGRMLKISVKEVVTHQGPVLTELQLIVLVVFGTFTLVLVTLTTVVVLKSYWQTRCTKCHCTSQRHRRTLGEEEECKISILSAPMPDLQKKLNTEII